MWEADCPWPGFKLDTLLKLADVKGTDRRTSLLHFVLDQLLRDGATASVASLPTQLSGVQPAANLQVPLSSKYLSKVTAGDNPCASAAQAAVAWCVSLVDHRKTAVMQPLHQLIPQRQCPRHLAGLGLLRSRRHLAA